MKSGDFSVQGLVGGGGGQFSGAACKGLDIMWAWSHYLNLKSM